MMADPLLEIHNAVRDLLIVMSEHRTAQTDILVAVAEMIDRLDALEGHLASERTRREAI